MIALRDYQEQALAAEAHADEVPCCLRCDECLAAIAVAMEPE